MTKPDASPYPSPDDVITVTVAGEPREIFMSFGLKQTLAKKVGPITNVQAIPLILVDPTTQEDYLREVLAERTPSGKIVGELKDLYEHEIADDDVDRLIEWVVDHLVDFFIRKLKVLARVQDKMQTAQDRAATSSAPSTDGSAA